MPHIVSVTLPIATARSAAYAVDRSNAANPLCQVKIALAQAFGEGALRPWRLLKQDDHIYSLIGWTRDPDALKPTPASRALGAIAEEMTWPALKTGDVVLFDIVTTPVKSVHTANRTTRTYVDVALQRDSGQSPFIAPTEEQRLDIWTQWLRRDLSAPRTGLDVIERPLIVDKGELRVSRRFGEDRRPVALPTLHALFKARIVDAGAAGSFLLTGFKRGKDIGSGCILPAEFTIDAVEALSHVH